MKAWVTVITTAMVWGAFLTVVGYADELQARAPRFMDYFFYYIAVANLVGFAAMLSDKRLARTKRRRVPERHLFWLTAAGGGIGTTAGMFAARHKTQHLSFRVWLPAITAISYSLLLTETKLLLHL